MIDNSIVENAILITLSPDKNESKLGFECINGIWDQLTLEQQKVFVVFCGIDIFNVIFHNTTKILYASHPKGWSRAVPKFTTYTAALNYMLSDPDLIIAINGL